MWERAAFCWTCSLLEQQLVLMPSWHCHVNYIQWVFLSPDASLYHFLLLLVLSPSLFLSFFHHILPLCFSSLILHLMCPPPSLFYVSVYSILLPPSFSSFSHWSNHQHPCCSLDPVGISNGCSRSLSTLSQLPCCLWSIKSLHCNKVKYLCNFRLKQIVRLAH